MNNYAAYPPPQPALGPLRAVLGAFGALALTSATVLAATHPPAAGLYPPGLHQLYLAGRNLSLALGVSLVVVLCQRARFKRRQAYILLGAVSLALGASTVLATGYPAAPLFIAAAAVALLASALVSAPLPRRWTQLQSALPWAFAAAIAGFALLVPPSRSMQVQMLHHEEDVLTPMLARLNWGEPEADPEVAIPAIWQPWFEPRDPAKLIPASKPPAKPPIVLLLTIDSLRADVLATRDHDEELPNLAAFRDASLRFSNARTPGSQTLTTLTSLFTGTYFSQQYWTTRPSRPARPRG